MKIKTLLASIFSLVLLAGSAEAALIAQFQSTTDNQSGARSDSLNFEIGYDDGDLDFILKIFDVSFTDDQVFTLDSGDAFDAVVAMMTDGVSQGMGYWNGYNGFDGGDLQRTTGGFAPESSFLFGSLLPPLDLSGYIIESFVLSITNVRYVTSVNRTVAYYNWSFEVYGTDAVNEVPIPAAFPLFLAGLAGIGFLKRKAKNR